MILRVQYCQCSRLSAFSVYQSRQPCPKSSIKFDGRSVAATLEAVNDGEAAHVSVAAASILAKHARDQAFAEIASRYHEDFGPLGGGGYLNAPTRAFLDAYARRHGGLPPEARRSWGAPKYATADPVGRPPEKRSDAPT